MVMKKLKIKKKKKKEGELIELSNWSVNQAMVGKPG